jgi:hypothetical protein
VRLDSVDDESYIPGSRALCRENVRHAGLDVECFASLNATRGRRSDLIHVDADHSKEGALLDMAHCWALRPRVMLVDDYLFLGDVREAVHTFARRLGLPFKVWRSYRGWAVFADADVRAGLPDTLDS